MMEVGEVMRPKLPEHLVDSLDSNFVVFPCQLNRNPLWNRENFVTFGPELLSLLYLLHIKVRFTVIAFSRYFSLLKLVNNPNNVLPELDPLDKLLFRFLCLSSALSKAPERRRIAAKQAAVADIGLVVRACCCVD